MIVEERKQKEAKQRKKLNEKEFCEGQELHPFFVKTMNNLELLKPELLEAEIRKERLEPVKVETPKEPVV